MTDKSSPLNPLQPHNLIFICCLLTCCRVVDNNYKMPPVLIIDILNSVLLITKQLIKNSCQPVKVRATKPMVAGFASLWAPRDYLIHPILWLLASMPCYCNRPLNNSAGKSLTRSSFITHANSLLLSAFLILIASEITSPDF